MLKPIAHFLGCFVIVLSSRAHAEFAVFDPSFGTNGATILSISDSADFGQAIVHLPDGRFFIAGGTSPHGDNLATMAMLRADGKLDTTFQTGGYFQNPFIDAAYTAARDPSGRLLVGGGGAGPYDRGFTVLGFTTNGNLDPTWGAGGVASVPISPIRNYPQAFAFQGDGKAVVVGESTHLSDIDYVDFATVRFTQTGQIDTSFNQTGVRTEDFELPGVVTNEDLSRAVLVQSDGKIVVGGASGNLRSDNIWRGGATLVRYNPDGSRDPSFGDNGLVVTPFPVVSPGTGTDGWDMAIVNDLKQLPDGRILAAGRNYNPSFVLAAYNPDGTLDTTFGQGGKVEVPSDLQLPKIVLQPNGRIRIVGIEGELFDGLFDAHGQLLQWKELQIPSLPGLAFQEYDGFLVMDDGDLVAVGRAAPESAHGQPNWIYTTDILAARFDRSTSAVPEPGLFLLLAIPLAVASRRTSRSK
jgi:uncharacterized delta-60 repeat protein